MLCLGRLPPILSASFCYGLKVYLRRWGMRSLMLRYYSFIHVHDYLGGGGYIHEGLSVSPRDCCLLCPIFPQVVPYYMYEAAQPHLFPVEFPPSNGTLVYNIPGLLQYPNIISKGPLMWARYCLTQRF